MARGGRPRVQLPAAADPTRGKRGRVGATWAPGLGVWHPGGQTRVASSLVISGEHPLRAFSPIFPVKYPQIVLVGGN